MMAGEWLDIVFRGGEGPKYTPSSLLLNMRPAVPSLRRFWRLQARSHQHDKADINDTNVDPKHDQHSGVRYVE
jgi:hypothetical protein